MLSDVLARVASKIRRSEIVLWAGAGFNKKAGLPLGPDLVSLIKEDCSDCERKLLAPCGDSLPEVAEQFVQMRSGLRTPLNQILDRSLVRDNVDLSLHEKVRGLVQIRHIVTTNYDRLFEKVYGTSIHTVTRSARTVPVGSSSTVRLFKVHGDIEDKDTIVICRCDYTRLLNSHQQEYVWQAVSALIAEKSVLFLGYGFDDQSVDSVFSNMIEMMGDLRQESYFVAPNVPEYKRMQLARRNIASIDMTAEEAIDWLHGEVQRHFLEDYNAGLIRYDEANDTMRKLFDSTIVDVQMGNRELTIIRAKNPLVKIVESHRLTWNQFLRDIARDSISLPRGAVEGLDLSDSSTLYPVVPDISQFSVNATREPNFRGRGTLMTAESNKIALPVEVRSFAAYGEERLDIEHETFILRFIKKGNIVTIEHMGLHSSDLYSNTLGVQFLIAYLERGVDLVLSVQGAPPKRLHAATGQKDLLNGLKQLQLVFESLMLVEESYGLSISVPETIYRSDLEPLEQAAGAVQGRRWALESFTVEMMPGCKEVLACLEGPNAVRSVSESPATVTLFGHELTLGVEVAEATDAIVVNRAEVEDALANGRVEPMPVTFASKSGDLVLYYDRGQCPKPVSE